MKYVIAIAYPDNNLAYPERGYEWITNDSYTVEGQLGKQVEAAPFAFQPKAMTRKAGVFTLDEAQRLVDHYKNSDRRWAPVVVPFDGVNEPVRIPLYPGANPNGTVEVRRPITDEQRKALFALLHRLEQATGVYGGVDRQAITRKVIGRNASWSKGASANLTEAEAGTLLDALTKSVEALNA